MIQKKLFERPRKRPANSMAAKLWDTYGTTEGGRSFFRGLYRGQGGEKPGRAADRATAKWLELANPRFKGITWRVVQDFRLKLGPAMGGGTHPHRGSKRKKRATTEPSHTIIIEALDDQRATQPFRVGAIGPKGYFELEELLEPKEHTGGCMGCDPGPLGAEGPPGIGPRLDEQLPVEPPAAPLPLKGPPKWLDLAARFLERLFETGQVGVELDCHNFPDLTKVPDLFTPEQAAQIAKRAAKALVDA